MKTTNKILVIVTLLLSTNLLANENNLLKELEQLDNSINKQISEKCLEKYTDYKSKKYKQCFINTRLYFNTKVLKKLNDNIKEGQNDK